MNETVEIRSVRLFVTIPSENTQDINRHIHNANNVPRAFSTAIMSSAAEILRDYLLNKYKNIKIIGPERKSWLKIISDQNPEVESVVYVNDSIIHPNNRGWYDLSQDDYNKLVLSADHYYAIMLEKNPEHTFVIPGSKLEVFFSHVELNFKQGKWQWDFSIIERNGSHNTLVVNRAPGKEHPLAEFLNKWDQVGGLKEKAKDPTEGLSNAEESTWIRDLIDTFMKLGGAAKYYHLSDIYKTFALIRSTKGGSLPEDHEAIIRYYLQLNSRGSRRNLFQPKEIGSGYWMLKETPESSVSLSFAKEILSCLQTFPDEHDLEKIGRAHEALNSVLSRYPYNQHPDLIDKLQVNDIYQPGSKETFHYSVTHGTRSVGYTAAAANEWQITEANLDNFKKLLKKVVDKNVPLSEKVDDAVWEETLGFRGEKQIPKKIVYLYNSDISLAVFSMRDMELFSTKLGKDFRENAKSNYGKDYDTLSEGQKYELHTELLLEAKNAILEAKNAILEAKNAINDRWDNTTFHRFLYHCIKSEPSSEEKNTLQLETFEDEPLSLPTHEEMENGYEKILNSLLIPKEKVIEIVTALASGRHVLLAGPIGTGKTRLAQLIPELFWEKIGGYYAEYYTATADWNTQDVIGGIYPKMENGKVSYDIQYGCVAETVARNWEGGTDGGLRIPSGHLARKPPYRGTWLVIDEFNRADIDKAFGQLFTALRTRLLKIPTNETGTSYKELRIPQDYRIIGTLNTADKHFLFQLSDALKSRFAYIEIDIPRKEDFEKEVYYAMKNAISELRLEDYEDFILLSDTSKKVLPGRSDIEFYNRILQAYYFLDLVRIFKKLGTAILQLIYQNMLVAIRITKDPKLSLDNALTSTLIPQLENLSSASLGTIEALYNENIVQYFKDAYKSPNRQSYGESFEKVLEYLQIGDYKIRAEEFSTGVMKIENDNIWGQIQTAFEDKKKNFEFGLIQFKQGIADLRKSAVV